MPAVLAVDGNSLAHRAWHAGNEDGDGHFVTHGVVGMLARAWPEGPYDAVVIAFDSPRNVRKERWPEYKANRPDKDPELEEHLQLLRVHLDQCGFVLAEQDGAEGDDVLASVATACSQRAWTCDVLSSDRDLLALIDDHVAMLRPRSSMADLQRYDANRVLAEYGVLPGQYSAFAALRGDPSDGLVGVHGIGPKTAARLLRDYGNLDTVYASLANMPPRIEAQLRRGRERLERNLAIMAPLPDVEVDIDAAVAAGVDLDCVVTALVDLGLGPAAGRFQHAVERPALPPMPPPPDIAPDEAVATSAVAASTDGADVTELAPRRRRATPVAPTTGEQVALF